MSEAIEKFRKAKGEYEAAKSAAAKIVSEIGKISNATQHHFSDFLSANYQLPARANLERGWAIPYLLQEWPDRSEMDKTFSRVVRSFQAYHACWNQLGQEDRDLLKAPEPAPSAK